MIKNYYSASNDAIREVTGDLNNNHEFGSLFQFWVMQTMDEIQSEFEFVYGMTNKSVDIDYDRLHKLAINIIKRIGSDKTHHGSF